MISVIAADDRPELVLNAQKIVGDLGAVKFDLQLGR